MTIVLRPKISIIIPSFNQVDYLGQTIESVLSQDFQNKELIVIDGGSPDGTVDILGKYDKHITYWISEPDEGQGHAINKGLSQCSGNIFNWLNSDDYLEPGALKAVADTFESNKETQVACGYTHCFYDESGKTSHTYRMGVKKSTTDTLLHIEMNQPGTF